VSASPLLNSLSLDPTPGYKGWETEKEKGYFQSFGSSWGLTEFDFINLRESYTA
jgi:hypothetical protein